MYNVNRCTNVKNNLLYNFKITKNINSRIRIVFFRFDRQNVCSI